MDTDQYSSEVLAEFHPADTRDVDGAMHRARLAQPELVEWLIREAGTQHWVSLQPVRRRLPR